MNLFDSLAGMVLIELTSADPGGALDYVSASGIQLHHAEQVSDLTVQFQIRYSDLKRLKAITERKGERIAVKGRLGLYWSGKRLLKRPVLLVGVLLLLLLAAFLPTRIFFVRVEGNISVPARLILAEAENCGISFGVSRREVRSEKMKNALLSAIPELQWAGVNTHGCVAVISVREKTLVQEEGPASGVSSIVAGRDGVIVSSTVEQGNAVCYVGQAVREGQLLVSGYTDCGISIRAGRSVGEIFAQTKREITAITPSEYMQQREITSSQKKYALIIGKKRINFYKDSGILGGTYDKMSTVNYLTLPGGFTLPVAVVTEQWTAYDCGSTPYPDDSAQMLLDHFCGAYLKQQMVAGQVLQKAQAFTSGTGACQIRGSYSCIEMIGREQREEILEEHGKID